MKKRVLLMGTAAALIVAAMAGGSLAASQVSGDQAMQAPLNATSLSIQMETTDDSLGGGNWMPGSTVELASGEAEGIYTVKNTGNVDSYVRVTLYAYWGDADQVNTGFTAQDEQGGSQVIQLEITPDMLGEGWLQASGGLLAQAVDGKRVFYYSEPLAGGQSTTALLKSIRLPEELDNQYQNQSFSLKVKADGVQFIGGEYNEINADGILSAWGVKATLGEDGSILSLEN